MNIAWCDVENVLSRQGASANEINSKRQIFNNSTFQLVLVRELGIITDRSFFELDPKGALARTSGELQDLAELDTYDLIDFISDHDLSFRQASSVTPQQMSVLPGQLVDRVSQALIGGLEDPQDPIRYSLSAIVQTGFPYRPRKGQQHFERKNGDLTVTMSAPNDIGLPSGIYPRLAFVHICSEIVKRKESRINLGPSLKRFVVDEMGRPWSTGKKGTADKWKQAICSLLATSFTISYKYKENDREGVLLKNVSIANQAHLWWDSSFEELKGAEIEVSPAFADALLNHATPLDIRALKSLSELRSPLAFDLYCWLTYRYWRMEDSKQSISRISWKQLFEQLGTGSPTVRHFKVEAKRALEHVRSVYPAANFSTDQDSYLILISSPPHISPQRISAQAELSLED